MPSPQKDQITLFLMLFKKLAGNHFLFVCREKSLDTLARIGITIEQAKSLIMSLTYEDYCRGPVKDTGGKGGELWEFGKDIDGNEIFIRLKVLAELECAKCQSFHLAEKPIRYAFK